MYISHLMKPTQAINRSEKKMEPYLMSYEKNFNPVETLLGINIRLG